MNSINIPESTRQSIYKCINDKADEFLSQVDGRLEEYIEKWQLSELSFMPTNTVNLLFSCESALYGLCVLKMCIPGAEVVTEINCLRFYDETSYCKLWGYDLTDDVLLLERVMPGDPMWAVRDYRERARFLGMAVKDLHLPYSETERYPTYLSWMEKIHRELTDENGMKDMLYCLDKAMEIYAELKQRHTKTCLLHGDLHQENMLRNSNGSYTIIDPKGVVDAPVMETARFLMNEVFRCRDSDKVREMVSIISKVVNFSARDILSAMFIDAALGQSWHMIEHYAAQKDFEKAKRSALEIFEFVYGLAKENVI